MLAMRLLVLGVQLFLSELDSNYLALFIHNKRVVYTCHSTKFSALFLNLENHFFHIEDLFYCTGELGSETLSGIKFTGF